MTDPFKKVQAGQSLDISAQAWNAFLDNARAGKFKTHNQSADPAVEFRQADIIVVRNDSGQDCNRFSVLGIGSPIISPNDHLREFKNQVAVSGVVPNHPLHFGKFVILLEPLRNGKIGRAWGSAVCPAYAVWDDDDVYLPWHLSFSLAEMRKHQAPLYRPAEYWAWWGNDFGFHHNQAIRGWMHHAMILFTREIWQQVDGYPAMNVREDAEFIDRVAGQLGIPFQRFPVNVFDRSFILRGKSKYAHMSMKGGEKPLDTRPESIELNPIDIADEQLRFHRDQLIRVHTESGEPKRIVIGLGSGRCGTTSLAALLGLPHEQSEPLPWQVDEQALLRRLSVWKSGEARVVGDVGFYYLPYVKLLREHADCRFISLKRNRKDTIASFMRHSAGTNHWMNHNGKRWRSDPRWDVAFPKYEMGSKAEAIGRYWDEYYEMASVLSASDDFLLFETEALNDSGKCEEIVVFAGINRKAVVGLNLNPGKC